MTTSSLLNTVRDLPYERWATVSEARTCEPRREKKLPWFEEFRDCNHAVSRHGESKGPMDALRLVC